MFLPVFKFSVWKASLLLLFVSVLLFDAAIAGAEYELGGYYENQVLSDLLEKEGFVFGVSKEEASAAYGLIAAAPENPLILSNQGLMESHSSGFYVAVIDEVTSTLTELAKCLRIEEGLVDVRRRKEEFKAEFGLKDENGTVITLKGIDSDILPLMHNGRKLQVALNPVWIEESNRTAIILTVVDETNETPDCF